MVFAAADAVCLAGFEVLALRRTAHGAPWACRAPGGGSFREGGHHLAGEQLERTHGLRGRDAAEVDLHRGLDLAEDLAGVADLLDHLSRRAHVGNPAFA